MRAQHAIGAVVSAAEEQGLGVAVAVVDPSGVLVGFARTDAALVGPVEVALKKARTAALFGTDSADLGAQAQPGGSIYSLEHTNGGLISFGGGVALRDAEVVVGAIGVAGADVTTDEQLARLGAARF
ncbi:GlcG/HbpS family heme-binding protein [Quadrisphaera granulorum]|uniref:GlcG/HbpS family heme-binding protein n=1 Tax=Quadrisphaera granulorum TaxID=317664 RepID=UPI000D6C7BC7|nr:heme-binding protein [Quadrisphaera granulorum]